MRGVSLRTTTDKILDTVNLLAVVLHAIEVSQTTFNRWRNRYGGMKAEDAKRLKQLEDENKRLKEIAAVAFAFPCVPDP